MKLTDVQAFVSYMRSIYLQADKETFKLENYDPKAYAESLGLAGVPKIKFLKNAGKRGAAVEVAEPAWGSDEEASSDEAEADLADEEPAAASSQKVRVPHPGKRMD
jgi:ATP-dependent RNA helicase DDX10/DBP4